MNINNELAEQIEDGKPWEEKQVNHLWFHIIRDLVQSGTVAKVGAVPWAVYCVVKSHTGLRTGDAFPSTARISDLVGVSHDTVQRALKKLVEAKLLDVVKQRGKGNSYSVNEQVQIVQKSGEPWATGERKYVPFEFQQFIAELERLAKTGNLPTDKGITINLVVQNIQSAVNVNGVNHGDMVSSPNPADRPAV